mgnify:CR=1 FL=1
MEMSDNANSENTNQIEPAKGFNPELTTEEKLQAAAEFDDLVWLTLLRFAGDAETYDHTESMDRVKSQVLLEIPQKDGSYILVSVESALLDNGDKERSISIMEWNEGIKETHDYYIEDDQVLRYDDNIAERSRELKRVLRPEGIIIIRMVDRCNDEIENDKLEQQMGLNRQPVGVEEVHKLAKLLESAEPRKPY